MCGWVWPFFGWVWVGVGVCDLYLAGCVWVGVTVFWLVVVGCGYVFFLAGYGCVWPFLAGCEWVWVSVTFFWLGVGGRGWVWPFFGWVWVSMGKCGWLWVGVGECTIYNYPLEKCDYFRFSARKKGESFFIFTFLGSQLRFKHESPFEIPESFYLLKVNNKKRCETCSKLTIKTSEPGP